MSVKVYGIALATCTSRVLFTAFELGHPVELITIDFSKGEHKQPAHLARQPFGKIPVVEDGDYVIYEARPICRYLIEKYANDSPVQLIPSDIKQRGIFEQWMSLETNTYASEITVLVENFFATRMFNKPRNDAACKKASENLMRDGVCTQQAIGRQDMDCE
jgi:glutathione S-transferase